MLNILTCLHTACLLMVQTSSRVWGGQQWALCFLHICHWSVLEQSTSVCLVQVLIPDVLTPSRGIRNTQILYVPFLPSTPQLLAQCACWPPTSVSITLTHTSINSYYIDSKWGKKTTELCCWVSQPFAPKNLSSIWLTIKLWGLHFVRFRLGFC